MVKLGYMEKIEIPFQHCVLTGAVSEAFSKLVSQTMPTNDTWEFSIATNHMSIFLACPKKETAKWRKLVADYDKP